MFITFEGPEGGGKSTLIAALAERLRAEGKAVLVTREPGSGEVGTRIRQILLDGGQLDYRCELFLFLADRAQHVATEIRPALERGETVLCDRYADSTIVYQGYGRGLDIEQLREWNNYATGNLKPDITFLLDLPPEVGLARIKDKDRLDNESLEFHCKIRKGFLKEAKQDPRWHVLVATLSAERIAESAAKILWPLTNPD